MSINNKHFDVGSGIVTIGGEDPRTPDAEVGHDLGGVGDVNWEFTSEQHRIVLGSPGKLRGVFAKLVTHKITVQMYELWASNVSIAVGGIALAAATCGTFAGHIVAFNTDFALDDISVQFTHIQPNTLKRKIVFMPKANVSGNVKANFSDADPVKWDVTFEAIADETSTDCEMGYYFQEDDDGDSFS